MTNEKSKLSRGSFLRNCFKTAGALILSGKIAVKAEAANSSPPPKNPLPLLLKEESRFETGMQRLAGIAIGQNDRVYAAGERGIKVFDSSGRMLKEIPSAAPATCVTVGPDGMMYVGHRGSLEKIDSEGHQKWAWGNDEDGAENKARVYYTSLALDGEFFYAADAGSRSLKRFSTDGDFVDEISKFEIPSPFFDCVADGNGSVMVANTGKHRIETYDRNGNLRNHWGAFGTEPQNFCGCCNPTSFAIFPDGKIVTTEKGIPRLKIFTPDHQLIAFLGSEAFPEGVAGMHVAIDSKQRILLSEPKKGEIRIYGLSNNEQR